MMIYLAFLAVTFYYFFLVDDNRRSLNTIVMAQLNYFEDPEKPSNFKQWTTLFN